MIKKHKENRRPIDLEQLILVLKKVAYELLVRLNADNDRIQHNHDQHNIFEEGGLDEPSRNVFSHVALDHVLVYIDYFIKMRQLFLGFFFLALQTNLIKLSKVGGTLSAALSNKRDLSCVWDPL